MWLTSRPGRLTLGKKNTHLTMLLGVSGLLKREKCVASTGTRNWYRTSPCLVAILTALLLTPINGCMEEKLVYCALDACCTVLWYFLFMSKLAETESTLRGLLDLRRNSMVRAAVCQHLVFDRFCAGSMSQ